MTRVWEQSPYSGDRLLLHLALADFANDEGECWPSQRTLARKARCSVRWVREAIAAMVADETVEIVEQTVGRGGRTLYRLKGELTASFGSGNRGTVQQVKRNSGATLSLLKNHQEPSLSVEEFNKFWQAYPRKVAKGAAARAWAKIAARPDAPPIEHLLRAVATYEASVSDPKYICHPATWLGQERWNDELSAATQTQAPEPERFRQTHSFVAGLAAAGRSRTEVEDALQGRDPEEVAAGLALYDALRAGARMPAAWPR